MVVDNKMKLYVPLSNMKMGVIMFPEVYIE